MSQVNYHLLSNSIVLNYEGKTFTLAKSDKRFDKVIDCIRNKKMELIPSIVDVAGNLRKLGFQYENGEVLIDNEPMPTSLLRKVEEFAEVGLPADIFNKFWENLKQNPSPQARKMLYDFLLHNGHPLTEDGCFIAYRGVTENFRDPHTGKFDNSPGSVCEMDRAEVDHDPNRTCSAGLHVASWSYAKDFSKRVVEVKVNPRDVVAVPIDYNGTKMRVCRFEVVRESDGIKLDHIYNQQVEPQEYDADVESAQSNTSTYLVRLKGEKKWDKIEANDFSEAAHSYFMDRMGEDFDEQSATVYVRKGSNNVQKFEF